MGKSVIIKQVIQRLESDGIKCYAIKADKLLTPVGFTSNEHLEQLRNTFASLMQEERSVLIIDQIDALSQYINSDRSKLDNITTLIKLFSDNEDQRNVRIIVSCRSFDLEFDPKLSLLGHEPQVKLGLLDKKDVEKVLDRLKVGLYKELDEKTISVLQTPQHLNIFCRVYRKNEKKDYYSITELYDELWLQVIGLTEAKINKSVAEKILYDLALKIYRDEELTPQWDYDISELKEANYLISEGIIEKTGNRATFFHQSMYDYVFARYYTKEKRSLIQDLLTEKKHQGLFVRSTVNFVLDYERAKNIKQYKEDIKIIMFSGQIRTHIQFILLWALANRTEILPFEKKCINELYAHDSFLFYSFINHVGSKQWYDTIISIILTDLKELKDSSPSYNSICSFLCNNINHLLVEVFNAANLIKDEKTKESVIKQLLFYTHDFTQDIVLNWYQSLCKTIDQKIDFLEKAIESNYEFVLDNIGEIIDHELDPELEEKNRLIERGVEIICKSLTNNHFEKFYPLLKDRIINFYINQRVVYTKRPYYIRTNNTQSLLCDCHEMMLIKMVGYSPETVFGDIKKLISANEDNCYKVAFKAMIVNPILFSEDIMTILNNSNAIDNLLQYYNDTSYYFLELIKKWLTLVDEKMLSTYQELTYNFKSSSDHLYDKDRTFKGLLYPYLGLQKRKLIWAIPEKLRNNKIKRVYQELNRRYGDEWENKKPDHDITSARICGGLMSTEQYRTVKKKDWLKSFYNVQCFCKGKHRFFDERVHADAFCQCVTDRPYYFDKLVFDIFDDDLIPFLYKCAGLEGLVSTQYPLDNVLPYIHKSMALYETSSNSYGYRLFEIINKITNYDGCHIDKIEQFLKTIILSKYESNYSSILEKEHELNDNTIDLLNVGLNSHHGQAIKSLAIIGKLPLRKKEIYQFFLDEAYDISVELQLTALYYLQAECFENELYNKLMFCYANKPISDYLFLNANRMHWFWCNNPEKILPYFKIIMDNKRAHKMLAQILFFGMQYEKISNISKEMFEKILSYDETVVICKLLSLSFEHLSDETYSEQSESFIRKYANDERSEVKDTLFIWCEKIPDNKVYLFVDILRNRLCSSIGYGIYDIIRYLEKYCYKHPSEAIQCISLLNENEDINSFSQQEKIIGILTTCYRIFLDEDDIDKADETMDLFDKIIKKININNSKILKQIDNA